MTPAKINSNPNSKAKSTPAPAPPPSPAEPASDLGPGSQEAWTNRRASEQATRAANARQTSGRRRFVDPTTCERDYSGEELEFMQAMTDYKKRSGRMFPTWSEVLEVIREMGYVRAQAAEAAASKTASA